MSIDNDLINEYVVRLSEVLDEIKKTVPGVRTYGDIAKRLHYKRAGTISDYKNPANYTKQKFSSFLEDLKKEFNVNPDYVFINSTVKFLTKSDDKKDSNVPNDTPTANEEVIVYNRNEARLRGDHSSDQYYMNSAGKVFTQIGEDSYLIHTPLVQKKARAGFLMGWGDETYINQLPTHPIVVDRPYKGYYVSFDVVGDSMDDGSKQAISDGDIVTGRRIDRSLWTSQLHIHDYPDFVIHTREGLLVKRIIAHNVKEGYITIHSLNPDKETYPDQDISLEDVAELFNIIKVTSDRKAR